MIHVQSLSTKLCSYVQHMPFSLLQVVSYTIFTFPLFFDLIFCSFILISFRLYDASAFIMFFLSCYLQPPSLHPPSSILCPTFHPPSLHHSVTLIPILYPPSPSSHLPSPCLPTPCCSVLLMHSTEVQAVQGT